jgi:hypothetical protein
MVEPSPSEKIIFPRKVIGLIVANSKYDEQSSYDDLTFTEEEIKRIEPLFRRFTDEV